MQPTVQHGDGRGLFCFFWTTWTEGNINHLSENPERQCPPISSRAGSKTHLGYATEQQED